MVTKLNKTSYNTKKFIKIKITLDLIQFKQYLNLMIQILKIIKVNKCTSWKWIKMVLKNKCYKVNYALSCTFVHCFEKNFKKEIFNKNKYVTYLSTEISIKDILFSIWNNFSECSFKYFDFSYVVKCRSKISFLYIFRVCIQKYTMPEMKKF